MHKKSKSKSNLSIAVVFIALVVVIVAISLIFRAFWVVKESSFDPSRKFNLEIVDKNGVSVISFSPKEKSISILKFEEKVSGPTLSSDWQIPIDAYVEFENKKFDYLNISSNIFSIFYSKLNARKNLTSLDILRLSLFARTVSSASTYERKLFKNYSGTQKSTIFSLTFKDPDIFSEEQSIEIINGTNISGLGNRLANLVSNMGGNVILVNSKDLEKKSKIIYFKNKSYTVSKLSRYLNYEQEEAKNRGVADVIIVIGQDGLDKLKF